VLQRISKLGCREVDTLYPCTSTTLNLPAQQNYGNSKTENWNRVAGTEQPMSIIHLAHTFWQCSGGFLAILASWRSHGQWQKLSHIHVPATYSRHPQFITPQGDPHIPKVRTLRKITVCECVWALMHSGILEK
jgi:hypothetical protein